MSAILVDNYIKQGRDLAHFPYQTEHDVINININVELKKYIAKTGFIPPNQLTLLPTNPIGPECTADIISHLNIEKNRLNDLLYQFLPAEAYNVFKEFMHWDVTSHDDGQPSSLDERKFMIRIQSYGCERFVSGSFLGITPDQATLQAISIIKSCNTLSDIIKQLEPLVVKSPEPPPSTSTFGLGHGFISAAASYAFSFFPTWGSSTQIDNKTDAKSNPRDTRKK